MSPLSGYLKAVPYIIGLLLIVYAAYSLYSWGYSKAEAIGNAKLASLEEQYTKQLHQEYVRQVEANKESKRLEAERLMAMEEEKQKLETLVGKLQDEEKLDPNRDHCGISNDSRMRIDQVR